MTDSFESEWEKVSAERAGQVSDEPADTKADPADSVQEPEAAEPSQEDAVKAALAEAAKATESATAAATAAKEAGTQASTLAEELKQAKADLAKASQPSQQEIAAAAADPEEWARLKEENPEWAAGIEKILDLRVKAALANQIDPEKIAKQVEERLLERVPERVDTTLSERRKVETQIADARRQVEEAHPGWQETVATPDFKAWKDKQSPGIQALWSSPQVADAIAMLNLYSSSKPAEKPSPTAEERAAERKQKLSQAVMPQVGAHQPRTNVSIDDMSWEDAWDATAKLKAAKAA